MQLSISFFLFYSARNATLLALPLYTIFSAGGLRSCNSELEIPEKKKLTGIQTSRFTQVREVMTLSEMYKVS